MLKIGLIGAGFMGGMHAACYQALADEGVCVTAVAAEETGLGGIVVKLCELELADAPPPLTARTR